MYYFLKGGTPMTKMKIKIYQGRLLIIVLLCIGIIWLISPASSWAQEKYPAKPINFIIGYPAGGSTDVCARPLVAAASKILGQPIVVINKPWGSLSCGYGTP